MISWLSFFLGVATILAISIGVLGMLAGLALRAPPRLPEPAPPDRPRRAAHLRLC